MCDEYDSEFFTMMKLMAVTMMTMMNDDVDEDKDLQGMSPFCRSMSEANILKVMVMMVVIMSKKRLMLRILMKKDDVLLWQRRSKNREKVGMKMQEKE